MATTYRRDHRYSHHNYPNPHHCGVVPRAKAAHVTLTVCLAVLGLLLVQAYLLANRIIDLPAYHRHKRKHRDDATVPSTLRDSSGQQHVVDDAHFHSQLLPAMRRYCSSPNDPVLADTTGSDYDAAPRKKNIVTSSAAFSRIPDDVAPTFHIRTVLEGTRRGQDDRALALSYEHLPTITCMADNDEYWFDDDFPPMDGLPPPRSKRSRASHQGGDGTNRTRALPFEVYFDAQSTQHITLRPLSRRSLKGGSVTQAVTLRRATALLLLDPEAAYSIYHLVADTMVALLLWIDALPWPNRWLYGWRRDWIVSSPPSSSSVGDSEVSGRPVVAVVVRRDVGHTELRRPCDACVRAATVLSFPLGPSSATDDEHQLTMPDVVTTGSSSTSNSPTSTRSGGDYNGLPATAASAARPHLRCYCDALFVPRSVLPLDALDARRGGYAVLRDRLGRVVQASPSPLDLSSLLSEDDNDALGPKLLFLQRATSRRIGNQDAIVSIAQRLGFRVRVEDRIERLSTEEQLLLFRDEADVVLMTHGMAAGWVPMMAAADTATTTPAACRTVVELQHRIRDFPPQFRFAELISRDNGLAHVLVRAVRAEFGPSVRNAVEAERYLMDVDVPIQVAMTHPAFFDQTAFYNNSEIEEALRVAFTRWRMNCKQRLAA